MSKKETFDQNSSEILIKLGLSPLQTKIYLALLSMQNATSAEIAKAASIARQQVYLEMPRMLEMGLAEKIIATPAMYQATPIDTCIEILSKQKQAEFSTLQQETAAFLQKKSRVINPIIEKPKQLIVASEKEIIFKRYTKEIGASTASIEAVGPAIANEGALLMYYPVFQRKLNQGVRVRILTEKIRINDKIQHSLRKLQESPMFEIRELPNRPPVQLAIHDKRRVDIVVPDSSNQHVDLWTNHPCLVTLAMSYFDEMWSKAKPLNTTNPK